MVFRYRSRLVISVQRYELVRKKQNNLKIFCFRGVWSEECGVRYAFKNKWFDICILYLSSILIPHSTLHTPHSSRQLHAQDHFTGISSNVFFSSCQKGATVAQRARSVVVCGDFIVGPRLTTSKCGYLPKMMEHSNPA